MALAPDPDTLQLHSPAIGPWFDSDIALPMPGPGVLSVGLTLDGDIWLPPAGGFLSFFIATTPRPPGLSELRGPDGTRAFAEGSFIALFRLLSWVERRIDAITTGGMGSITNNPVPTSAPRPIVRYFAMEFLAADAPTTPTEVETYLPDQFDWPSGVSTPEEKAANLGLTLAGATLGNGPTPMTDLHQPGVGFPTSNFGQELLQFPNSTPVQLWSFDHRGRPLDPGAVANWWSFLGDGPNTGFNNFYANSVAERTASVTPGLTFHLTNAHEGPLDVPFSADTDTNRLTITNGAANSTQVVQQVPNTGSNVTVAFTNTPGPTSPTADTYPQAEAAVLPDGTYGPTAVAWPGGVLATVPRDFCRIAVRSIEHDLAGQQRSAPAEAKPTETKRAADQHRPSTRVQPYRTPRGALQAGTQAVLATLGTPPTGTGQTTLVASVVDRDAGPATTTAAAGPSSTQAPALTAVALDGGGDVSGSIATGQRVLVTVTFSEGPAGAFAGAWVRLWPLGFDPATGQHLRLDGAGGLVDGNDQAFIVLPLPDGTVLDVGDTDGRPPTVAVDVMVVTNGLQTLYPDQRFDRPRPTGVTARVDVNTAPLPLVICSTGVQIAGVAPLAGVEPGSEVVALGDGQTDTPALVDRDTIPAVAFVPGSVGNLLGAGDHIELTAPAFLSQLDEPMATGEDVAVLAQGGATVAEQDRAIFDPNTGFWVAGHPYPGMERHEVVLAQPNDGAGNNGAAVVGATPLLGPLNALPSNAQGSPFSPGGPSVQGNGVLTSGSGAVPMAEYVRDRSIRSTATLVSTAAATPIVDPQTPTSTSLWIAGLRTEAKGVAAEIGLGALADLLNYPFDGTWDQVLNFLDGLIAGLPGSLGGGAVDARRAIDRRLNMAANGAREGATAMVSAIGRAEDFIYIETPAIDHLILGSTDESDPDSVSLWQAVMDRMDANPSLHVALCLPLRLPLGSPEPLQRARDLAATEALTAIASGSTGAGRAERFVAFSPAAGPARSLRIASTTMVVDDVVAFVGSTHLWRRGLSYDSSYAVAVIDEQQVRGRSAEVLAFRSAAMAAALDLTPNQLPLDPADTIKAIAELVKLGGFQRLAPERIRQPDPALTTGAQGLTELEIWNPDGSFAGQSDLVTWILGLQTAVANDVFNPGQP